MFFHGSGNVVGHLAQTRIVRRDLTHVDQSGLARGEVPDRLLCNVPVLGALHDRRASRSPECGEQLPQLQILGFQEIDGGSFLGAMFHGGHGQIPPSTPVAGWTIGAAPDVR